MNEQFKNNNLIMVSIYDKVSGIYTPPLIYTNKKTATRYYTNLLKTNPNPNHYQLLFIGNFDNTTCKIELLDNVTLVIDGLNIIDPDFNIEVL